MPVSSRVKPGGRGAVFGSPFAGQNRSGRGLSRIRSGLFRSPLRHPGRMAGAGWRSRAASSAAGGLGTWQRIAPRRPRRAPESVQGLPPDVDFLALFGGQFSRCRRRSINSFSARQKLFERGHVPPPIEPSVASPHVVDHAIFAVTGRVSHAGSAGLEPRR